MDFAREGLIAIVCCVFQCAYSCICAVLLQTDLAKEEESVEPIPQISDFVIDDLRKYVSYINIFVDTRIWLNFVQFSHDVHKLLGLPWNSAPALAKI